MPPTPAQLQAGGWAHADSVLFDTLIHEAPVAFAFYDREMRYQRINRLLAAINGVPIAEHIGRRPTEVLEPSIGTAIEAMLTQVLETESVVSDADFRSVGPSGEVRHWSSQWFPARDATGMVTGVAVIVVDVTERQRAQEALVASQRRTERLQQATAELASALTVDAVAECVRRIGRNELGADWSAVALVERQGACTLMGELPGARDAVPFDLRDPRARSAVTSHVLLEETSVYASSPDELAARGLCTDAGDGAEQEKAWAVVALHASAGVIGALRFSFADPRVLSAEERIFLEALAGQCTLALERARLYGRQRHTAHELQRALLPDELPAVEGLELAARYLPGGTEVDVGGDWYDVFLLPSGRVALVLGDVMGKGVRAAAGMGRVRSGLRALALVGESPAAVLTGLDRLVEATEVDEQIVTLVYVVVDPVSGWAVGASAGHPPLVHLPADGPPRLLQFGGQSTPLGVPEPRSEESLRLEPGGLFLAYSDGLVETRQRGLEEGMTQLLAEAARLRGRDVGVMLDDILANMLATQSSHDDVTLVALRYQGNALRHGPRRTATDVAEWCAATKRGQPSSDPNH